MTKIEQVIEALKALPEPRREEVADMLLDLMETIDPSPGDDDLTPEELAEAEHRRVSFVAGDSGRIDVLLARLK
ncbi:MAG: hypothetical protein IV086_02365 [Hyphomonadaceae bacterium]|nr:MAG: hypothetical protein FD160_2908 [Caulobacteraceae bacterium]MBT9444526.1 hypothetical protein [Hyphomonadaceae bacterium]TPW07811.1 MAG: hypothetical protein FD124_841 [Alphaproteobacteria bacterium]